MLKTLAQAKSGSLRNIAGACNNSPEFLQVLNDATERCLNRGDWEGTVVPIMLCVRNGCVVTPRYVGQVRKLSVCSRSVHMRNLWYDFPEYDREDFWGWWNSWCDAEANIIAQGRSPVWQDVLGDNRTIRAYPLKQADLGKTSTIFGLDDNNQRLVHLNVDNVWEDGAVITFGNPFGSTNTFVRRIERILKDPTEGDIRYYAYNATDDLLEDLVILEPSDTNPDFARYALRAPNWHVGPQTSACNCLQSVMALVKLKFVSVAVDTDLVLIENLQALKEMIQSLKAAEANDFALADKAEARAVRELNLQLWDRDQEGATIDIAPFNGVAVGQQRMF